jgi:hypothetical protein
MGIFNGKKEKGTRSCADRVRSVTMRARPNDHGVPDPRNCEGSFYVYQKNYEPARWPTGNPETGYMDTDGSPTKTEILNKAS